MHNYTKVALMPKKKRKETGKTLLKCEMLGGLEGRVFEGT
jgi:hypothetical protein